MNLNDFYLKVSEIYKNTIDRGVNAAEVSVGVKIESPGRIGSTPTTEVKYIFAGIDWDHNKVLIHTNEHVKTISSDDLAELTEKIEELGWSSYTKEKLSREIKELKEKLSKYE